ncbi:hypothetical protein V7426_09485 [Bacillus thuringiensis]|nr:hypothetical protein [Bacillus thuringiensis]
MRDRLKNMPPRRSSAYGKHLRKVDDPTLIIVVEVYRVADPDTIGETTRQ